MVIVFHFPIVLIGQETVLFTLLTFSRASLEPLRFPVEAAVLIHSRKKRTTENLNLNFSSLDIDPGSCHRPLKYDGDDQDTPACKHLFPKNFCADKWLAWQRNTVKTSATESKLIKNNSVNTNITNSWHKRCKAFQRWKTKSVWIFLHFISLSKIYVHNRRSVLTDLQMELCGELP